MVIHICRQYNPIPRLEGNHNLCSFRKAYMRVLADTENGHFFFMNIRTGRRPTLRHSEELTTNLKNTHTFKLLQRKHILTSPTNVNGALPMCLLTFSLSLTVSFDVLESNHSDLLIIGLILGWQCFLS